MFEGFIVIQRVKTRGSGNIVINVGYEMFTSHVEASAYIKGHYKAKKTKMPNFYENEDFVYEIKPLHKVEYNSEKDQLTIKEEEE